jgi:cytochrome P450
MFVFLDLLSSERANYELLQREAIAAMNAHEEGPAISLLAQLPGAESAIRESIRQHPLFVPLPCAKVVHKAGIMLPTGQHVRFGNYLGFPTHQANMNPNIYLEPEKYQPFRSLRASSLAVPTSSVGEGEHQGSFETEISASTVSESFLSFGVGRHAWYVFEQSCSLVDEKALTFLVRVVGWPLLK